MKKHFYDNAKVSSVIDRIKPRLIMEVGCGEYENLLCLLTYLYKEGNDYHVIGLTDNHLALYLPPYLVERFLLIEGISYNILKLYESYRARAKEPFRGTIDMAIIDSDHNYYTVTRELDGIYPFLSPKCALIFHDTNNYKDAGLEGLTFENIHPLSNSTYIKAGYANGEPYPKAEILETFHLSIVDAISDFIKKHPEFSVTYTTKASCGVYMIEREGK